MNPGDKKAGKRPVDESLPPVSSFSKKPLIRYPAGSPLFSPGPRAVVTPPSSQVSSIPLSAAPPMLPPLWTSSASSFRDSLSTWSPSPSSLLQPRIPSPSSSVQLRSSSPAFLSTWRPSPSSSLQPRSSSPSASVPLRSPSPSSSLQPRNPSPSSSVQLRSPSPSSLLPTWSPSPSSSLQPRSPSSSSLFGGSSSVPVEENKDSSIESNSMGVSGNTVPRRGRHRRTHSVIFGPTDLDLILNGDLNNGKEPMEELTEENNNEQPPLRKKKRAYNKISPMDKPYTPDELEKISSCKRLKEFEHDRKKVRTILANREAVRRSKQKKVQRKIDLENEAKFLAKEIASKETKITIETNIKEQLTNQIQAIEPRMQGSKISDVAQHLEAEESLKEKRVNEELTSEMEQLLVAIDEEMKNLNQEKANSGLENPKG